MVLKRLESLVAAALPLIDLTLAHDPDSAGGRLRAIKGRLFEATKMHMWDTMIRLTQDRKGEIPAVTLYRGAAAHHLGRAAGQRGSGGGGGGGSVMRQLYKALADVPLLRSKSKGKGMMAWQVSFVGEGGDDYGGLFRESIRELAADLQQPQPHPTALFLVSPNCRATAGGTIGREAYVPNPWVCVRGSPGQRAHFRQQFAFLGKVMGAGLRTSNPLGLDLPLLVWKRFLRQDVTVDDLADCDERFVRALQTIRTCDDAAAWAALPASTAAMLVGCCRSSTPANTSTSLPPPAPPRGRGAWAPATQAPAPVCGEEEGVLVWTVRSSCGIIFDLVPGGGSKPVAQEEREAFAAAALAWRLGEFDAALDAMRHGLGQNVPIQMLPLLTPQELMVRLCGEDEVDLEVLRGIVRNKLDAADAESVMAWLWQTLEGFSNEERKQFLGFVWGRERLPRDTCGLQLEVRTQGAHGDAHLPSSHTCFNALDIPRYSSQQVLEEKLRYAIAHCKAIDTDFAARTPLSDEPPADVTPISPTHQDSARGADGFAGDAAWALGQGGAAGGDYGGQSAESRGLTSEDTGDVPCRLQ